MKLPSKKQSRSVNVTINPILIVSKLAAVCTVWRDAEKDEFVVSRFMVFTQVAVTIVSILHLIFIPYAVICLEMMPKENMSTTRTSSTDGGLQSQGFITKMANIILISIAAITVRISNLCYMHRILPDILKSIGEVDRIIKKRNNDAVWILVFAVILILISWPYQMYSILMVTTNSWMAFLMFSLNLYNNFSIISCEFQFVSLCWILSTRFKQIKNELKDLETKIYIDLDESILGKLSKIRDSHRIMSECCARLNNLYGIPLLAILGSLTLNVLFTLYFAIFGGFKRHHTGIELRAKQISGSADYVIWSVYYFGRFMLICLAAGRLVEKTNAAKKIICNLFHKSSTGNVRQEIWIYLAYVMSNKIYFHACGFFKIDVSLVTSAVSTGATYLVILAQFQSRH